MTDRTDSTDCPQDRDAEDLRPRRPPAAPAYDATVTRLGARRRQITVAPVDGALALDLRPAAGMPATPELTLLDGGEPAVEDLHGWAAHFSQAVVEVVGGDRPLPQLVRWTSPRVYAKLGRRVRVLCQSLPVDQRLRRIRPQVRSVHVYQPTPASAEVSVHVRHGQRSRALAARLEVVQGRWRCTEIEFG